jgi:hypothetical protein
LRDLTYLKRLPLTYLLLNDEKTPLVTERDKVTDEVSILSSIIFGKEKNIFS